MFVDYVLQSLGCASNILAVTAVHAFVYIASIRVRNNILVDCRKNGFGGDYQPKLSCSLAIIHCSFDLLLEFKKSVADLIKF